VEEFFQYVLPSIPYGCAFALVAVGLVLTYRATGVFNFAFASEAYAAAVVYAELYNHGVQRGWAAVIVVLVVAPVFGAVLDIGLFSRIPSGNATAKIVIALGLMVMLPTVVQLIVGQNEVFSPPAPFFVAYGLVWTIGGVPINGQELCVVVATFGVLLVLTGLLRTRRFGLPIRAAVESPKLLELSGVDSRWTLRASWMISTALAALAGVLYAPTTTQVEPQYFSLVLVAAIAAAAVAGLKNLPLAVIGGIGLGVLEGVMQGYIPPDNIWSSDLVPSLPFFILFVLLVFHPTFRHLEESTDPMAAVEPPPPTPALALRPPTIDKAVRRWRWPVLFVAVFGVVLFVPSQWTSSLTIGASLAIIFLSITLLTGLAGQISLAQAFFAGIGAASAGQLANNAHFPILVAAAAGAAIAGLGGLAASLPALRLRGILPIALLTLCLALLGDSLLFPQSWILGGNGITIPRPSTIASISFSSVDSEGFFVLVVVVLILVGALVNLLLHGTTGRALSAVHASPVGAASAGVPVRRMTVLVFTLSAAIAGLGGAFWGMSLGSIQSVDVNYFFGPTYLVIVVAVGSTTVEGAVFAGMAYALVYQAFTYLSFSIGGDQLAGASLPVVVLAIGAFFYASHPEGLFEYARRRAALSMFRAVEHHSSPPVEHHEEAPLIPLEEPR
jgi:branched-chain amino acid transport system permease protein